MKALWWAWVIPVILLGVLPTACSMDKGEPSYVNPFDPVLGEGIAIPESIQVEVGDGFVRLSWRMPAGESADEYAIFRKVDDGTTVSDEVLKERTSAREYRDSGVRNDKTYIYRIAAGINGRFGRRSDEITARPGLYSIVLSDGKRLTRNRDITATVSAQSADAVRLSEDPDNFTSPWQRGSSTILWTLSAGDGEKTVYAQFRFPDGSVSMPVHDTIRLDTVAGIQSVGFDGPSVRSPGETIHFRLSAGEINGSATIRVDGVFASVPLRDDGSDGDVVASDGTYERDLIVPPGAAVAEGEVVGSFADEAGNVAMSLAGPVLLTIQSAPSSVDLLPPLFAEPPDPPSVTLRWSRSLEGDFAAYRIFRGETADVDSTDNLLETVRSIETVEYRDTDVVEGRIYYYRVYVQNDGGIESGSNTVQAHVPNVRPPDAVTLQVPDGISSTRIALDWSRSGELDFAAYRIYRNMRGAVSDEDTLLTQVTDADHHFWDDVNLRENTKYYYRVYVRDTEGLESRSNEVEGLTLNEPPPPVHLNDATQIEGTAATLSWQQSDVHDFAFYRVYRDTIAVVTTSSHQVVELDDRTFTAFRDTDLNRASRYYFRVFVFDDAQESKFAGSNTITFVTP